MTASPTAVTQRNAGRRFEPASNTERTSGYCGDDGCGDCGDCGGDDDDVALRKDRTQMREGALSQRSKKMQSECRHGDEKQKKKVPG